MVILIDKFNSVWNTTCNFLFWGKAVCLRAITADVHKTAKFTAIIFSMYLVEYTCYYDYIQCGRVVDKQATVRNCLLF